MIFAGSDLEMISKLAKSIAHFFVIQKVIEELKELINAYGMKSVPSACHYWFAQPVEPEELRNFAKNR